MELTEVRTPCGSFSGRPRKRSVKGRGAGPHWASPSRHCAHFLITKRKGGTFAKLTSWGRVKVHRVVTSPGLTPHCSVTKGKENKLLVSITHSERSTFYHLVTNAVSPFPGKREQYCTLEEGQEGATRASGNGRTHVTAKGL